MNAHIFLPVLIHRKMHGSKRAPSDFILDYVLIDTMLGLPILLVIRILRMRIERFFDRSMRRGGSLVVSKRTVVGGGGASICSESANERMIHPIPGHVKETRSRF